MIILIQISVCLRLVKHVFYFVIWSKPIVLDGIIYFDTLYARVLLNFLLIHQHYKFVSRIESNRVYFFDNYFRKLQIILL